MKSLAALAAAALGNGCASIPLPTMDPVGAANAQLHRWVEEEEVVGGQYLVIGREGILYERSFGVRDVLTGRPTDGETLHMAFSITKAITAIAVMQLNEKGRLRLSDPLSAHYHRHPYGEKVTLRHLLNHTSGVPSPAPLDWFATIDPEGEKEHATQTEKKFRALLEEHDALDWAPGERYGYGNLSYWLLEKVIEAASGYTYSDYVEKHIFKPLAISNDMATFAPQARPNRATGHARRWGLMNAVLYLMAPSEYWIESAAGWSRFAPVRPYGYAYGGLFCNAQALGRIAADLVSPKSRLLSADSIATMLAPQTSNSGKPTGTTLGWSLGEVGGIGYAGKQGGGMGGHANLRIYPTRNLATVWMATRTEISPGPIDERSDALDRLFLVGLRGEVQP